MNNSHTNSNQAVPLESAELNKQSKPGSVLSNHESDQQPRGQRKCKNHPEIEATRICLYAGCSLSREICEECQHDHPHSTHPEMVIDAKNFFAETEVSLRNLQLNSPQSVAMELLQQGRLFFLKHFQSMNNILIEKSPVYLKVLGLIEQSKGVGADMGTYELERYVRELMTVFEMTQSGRLQPIPELLAQFQDGTLRQSVNEIYIMLREIENAMIVLHDNFAAVLKFPTNSMDFNAEMANNNDKNKNYMMSFKGLNQKGIRKGLMQNNENSQMSSENSAGCGGYPGTSFAGSKNGNNNQSALSVLLQNGRTSMVKNEDLQINQSKNTNNSQVPSFVAMDQQLNPIEAHQVLINTRQAFLDPAFLKRSRGRPKGSKCKRKGKLKSKYTTEEKIQILQEVEITKSVQIVAEKHSIQNSLIRQWARQLKYELDPQTVASRRPYRTFSREKKSMIVAEAIFKRDIVLVAQEHDVNAQVLKRWILKSAQGEMLPQQEMRQLMNGMDGEGDGDEGDEGDEEEEEEEDDDDEGGEEEEDDDEGEDDEEEEDDDEEDEDMIESQKEGKLDKDKSDKSSKDVVGVEKSGQREIANRNHEEQGMNEETKQGNKIYEEDLNLGEQTKKKIKIESDIPTDKYDKEIQQQQQQQHPQEQQQQQQQPLQLSSNDKTSTVQVREMLKFDVLQTVDLKNLDINSDTKQQQENLQMMREQISKEILRLKQAQQTAGKQRNVTVNNNISNSKS